MTKTSMPEEKFKIIKVKFSQYLLLFFLFLLVAVLGIVEGNKFIKTEIDNYKNKEAQKNALEDRISNLNNLEKEYQNISPDIDLINKLLPTQKELISLVTKIEDSSSQTHVDISIKFNSEPQNHKLAAILSVKGFYKDVMNFYKSMTNKDILVDVKSVKFSNANNLLDNTNAEFGVEVYFD